MDETTALIETVFAALETAPPLADWHYALFAGTTLVTFVIAAHKPLKRAFLDWRAERRRIHPASPSMGESALLHPPDDESEEFDMPLSTARAVAAGAYATLGFWLFGTELGNLLEDLLFILPILGLPLVLWRYLNAPDRKPLGEILGYADGQIPREDVLVAIGAALWVLVVIVVVVVVF